MELYNKKKGTRLMRMLLKIERDAIAAGAATIFEMPTVIFGKQGTGKSTYISSKEVKRTSHNCYYGTQTGLFMYLEKMSTK